MSLTFFNIIFVTLSIVMGVGLGAFGMFFYISQKNKTRSAEIIKNAEKEAKNILHRADETAKTLKKEIQDAKNDLQERKKDFSNQEKRLIEKESKLDKKYEEIEQKHSKLLQKEQENEKRKQELENHKQSLEKKLEEIARLSQEEARNELLKITEEKYEKDILTTIEKKKKDLKNRSMELSREILISSIQQYAGDVTSEVTQTVFSLESDDLKGKLIGKE